MGKGKTPLSVCSDPLMLLLYTCVNMTAKSFSANEMYSEVSAMTS